MDKYLEALKLLAALVGALAAITAPIFKLFNERRGGRSHALEERYRRFKAFFEDGGVDRHALLVESSFATALGHTRLTAPEIILILKQRKPYQFIEAYLRSRAYLQPSDDGRQFCLTSIASRRTLSKALVALGLMLYILLVAPGMALMLFQLPQDVLAADWAATGRDATAGLLCVSAGLACLFLAAQLHWAHVIVDHQVAA